jgi:hypothetical protein
MKRDCEHPRANHQHGTAIAYTHDACRCPQCTEAHRQNAAHTRKQKAYGRYTQHHRNPDKARQHIQNLKQAGMSYNQQAKLTGLTVDTIKRIARNQPRTITHTTEPGNHLHQPHRHSTPHPSPNHPRLGPTHPRP